MRQIHQFFYQKDFIQVSAPILMPAASEGASNLFPVEFFDERQVFFKSNGAAAHGIRQRRSF